MKLKRRVTKKSVYADYGKENCIEVGYCGLQSLLRYESPYGYTEGVYGWNADLYAVGDYHCIVTGYRPFGGIRPSYDVIRKYEERAEQILKDYGHLSFTCVDMMTALLAEFVEEVTA